MPLQIESKDLALDNSSVQKVKKRLKRKAKRPEDEETSRDMVLFEKMMWLEIESKVWAALDDSKRLKRYEGFDTLSGAMVQKICYPFSPCCSLVRLYARLGLHRYNLLQSTNLQLSRVKKYSMTTHAATSSYFVTLVAVDPASDSLLTFQTKVCERSYGGFKLACSIACLKSTHEGALGILYYPEDGLPKCPLEDPFENGNLFYVVENSELQQHYDWIRLYLELAIGTALKSTSRDLDLSDLKIVKVAIETIGDDVEPQSPNKGWLNAMNAIVYIRYTDFCEARVGIYVDRVAIVRRTFNQSLGCFMLDGLNQSSSEILPKKKSKKQSRRFGVHKSLRLTHPLLLSMAKKHCRACLARRRRSLHKRIDGEL